MSSPAIAAEIPAGRAKNPATNGLAGRLDGLNSEQRRAVEHFEGPCLVLAGAGSGKTRVLTTRICQLIAEHGVSPDRILAVTFTNKAAAEMRERVAGMLGAAPKGIWMGTFHGVGARLLRRHARVAGLTPAFAIRDAEQSLREVKRAAATAGVDPRRWPPKALRGCISAAKNALVGPALYAENNAEGTDPLARAAARVYPEYQKALLEQDAADFDDLLVWPVRMLERDEELRRAYGERFAFTLVDEYQDTNRAQFRFLELVARGCRNLMVVGDDDQSIYGWRGADIRNILDFEASFRGAAVFKLERNYRSTQAILDAANAVIRRNTARKEKTLRTVRTGGAPVVLLAAGDEVGEARWIVEEVERLMLADPELAHRDFAVLYRTNAQSRALEDRFRRRGVPYQIVGGVRFYERREIQDVLAYLRLIANPHDRDAFERAVNYPRRGVGRATLARLAAFAIENETNLVEVAARASELPGLSGPAVRGAGDFARLVRKYSALSASVTAGELLRGVIEEIGLVSALRGEGPDGEDRIENVKELIAGALQFDAEATALAADDVGLDDGRDDATPTGLQLFLQHVALVTDVDRHDSGADAVALMTLHSAKGLEFPVVFVAGLEEGLLPLARASEDVDLLEEERRLFYVGITRAKDRLCLTYARRRRRAGEYAFGRLSSFADPIRGGVEEKSAEQGGSSWNSGAWGRERELPLESPLREGASSDRVGCRDEDGFDQDRPRYAKGEMVVHRTFGQGAIVELSGFGSDLKVVVDFGEAGRKKLLVRYAGLQKDYV